MSDSLGRTLVEMRVKKGLSVEEVSAVTRVNAKLVRLIEEDQYDQLPGEVFIKGLLRSYAGVVGLSGDEVIARFNALGVHIKDRSPVLLVAVPLRPESRLIPKVFFFILAFLATASLIYYYVGPLEGPAEKPFSSTMQDAKPIEKQAIGFPPGEAGKTDAVSEPAPMQRPGQAPQPKKEPMPELKEKEAQPKQPSSVAVAPAQTVLATPTLKKPEPTPMQTRPAFDKPDNPQASPSEKGKHKLSVTASDVSWVSVGVDNGSAKQVFLNAGETKSWTGEKGFKLTIGNVSGTKVYLDGVEVKVKNAVQNVIKDMNIPVNRNEKPSGAEG